ncbi:hypothetical protein BgAZ_404180 [Babesia gibsoni]|uniref:Sfi1 spindle body domain-containing protein n=1 Tax=Babesia gibsoni TaxID=33632 RepID=A0AAD8LMZ6_BABGI|nr:hypothetical protein BgAZ_404180 [Babesia gibsoni]
MVSGYNFSAGLRHSRLEGKDHARVRDAKHSVSSEYMSPYEDGEMGMFVSGTCDPLGISPVHSMTVSRVREVRNRTKHIRNQPGSNFPVTPKSAIKHLIRRNAFRKWAKSYHGSVKYTLASEIANAYYAKHHSETAFKAFSCALKHRRTKEAKHEAENFALKVLLRRWYNIALNSATERSHSESVSIFNQTSLASRALKAFKIEGEKGKNHRHYIGRIVELTEKSLRDAFLTPLRQHAKNAKRIESCAAHIEKNRDKTIKGAFMGKLRLIGGCRNGLDKLEHMTRLSMLRQTWHTFVSSIRKLTEAEAIVEKAVRREKAVNTFDCWHGAIKEKHACQYYEFLLKYKSFNALGHEVEEESQSSPKASPSESNVVDHGAASSTIKAAVSQKRNIIMAAGIVSKVLQQWCKRSVIRKLRENVRIVENELLKEVNVAGFFEQRLSKRSLDAWRQYIDCRRNKAYMKSLGVINYKTYLLSTAFNAIRKRYIEKLETFDAELSNFMTKQRLLHKRMYFIAFAAGVQRSRSLKVTQGIIEKLHESQTVASVFGRIEGLTSTALRSKLTCLAVLGKLGMQCTEYDSQSLLTMFRDVVFRRHYDEKGVFRPFMECVLSSNIIAVMVIPLRSECIVFLYYISGLKTRALEMIKELGLRPDDLVVRLCESLTSKELAELNSKYAYQLYKVRLDGFPSIYTNSGASKGSSITTKASAKNEIISNDRDTSGSYSVVENSSGFVTSDQEMLSSKAVTSYSDTTPTVGMSSRLSGIPEWLPELLSKMTLLKVCNIDDMHEEGSDCCNNGITAFDILYCGFPLWRLAFTQLLIIRCTSLLKFWRTYTKEKQERAKKMLEISGSINGLFKMSILMKSFKAWLNSARFESSRRIAESVERCEAFTSIMSLLVYRSVSIVFIRLHLRRIMFVKTGEERLQQMRALSKSVVVSCRESDALAEIESFRTYKIMSRQFYEWRRHNQWKVNAKSKAKEFYRQMFLKQGWNAIQASVNHLRKLRNEKEAHLDWGLRRWRIGYYLDAWHKATLCILSTTSINPPSHVVMTSCLRNWKSYVRKTKCLSVLSIQLQRNVDNIVADRALNEMMDQHYKRSYLKELETRFGEVCLYNCVETAFQCWRGMINRNNSLRSIQEKISGSVDDMVKNHVFSTINMMSTLKKNDEQRLKHTAFRTMGFRTASTKVERILERHLDDTKEETCREFFELERALKQNEIKLNELRIGNTPVYAALVALSTLKETRETIGVQALYNNVVCRRGFRKAVELRRTKLLYNMFIGWRRCAVYNIRTARNSYTPSNKDGGETGKSVSQYTEESMAEYRAPSEDQVDRYFLVMASFKHWRNMTIMLPEYNSHELIEDFRTRNRQLDGLYFLKLHALSALWNRTCEARLHLLVDSMDCKLKWSVFHQWKTLSRDRMIELYDENHCAT